MSLSTQKKANMHSLLSFTCLTITMTAALGSQAIAALPPPIPPHEHAPPVIPNWELHSTKVSCPQIGEASVSLRWQKWHVNIESLRSSNYYMSKNDMKTLNLALSQYKNIEFIRAGCLDDTQFQISIRGFTRDIKPKMVYIRLQGKRLFLDR